MPERAAFYIDGFNLYHAIDDLRQPWLKWVDLRALAEMVIPRRSEAVAKVVWCSALATHKPHKMIRHRAYHAALMSLGVECVMGNFKRRPITRCHNCRNEWQTYEEKESDVNLAIHLLNDAHRDVFDHAYLVTSDSDLAAVVRVFRKEFPQKRLTSVATPSRHHAGAIAQLATGTMKLTVSQIGRCLLPKDIISAKGEVIAARPTEYDPPVR